MRKNRLSGIAVLVLATLLLLPHPAYAYIDPGTTGSVFAVLAPFIALFGAFLAFLIRPFRRFVSSLIAKFRRDYGTEPLSGSEPTVSVTLPDDGKSGENISEDPKS